MTILNRLRPALLGLALAALPAALLAAPAMTGSSAKGAILTDAKGMSLYTFDPDTAEKSACTDACAANWPPLAAAASDMAEGEFGILTRADGSRQWTYKGHPLYGWVKDSKPGDITGDGVKGVWHLARP